VSEEEEEPFFVSPTLVFVRFGETKGKATGTTNGTGHTFAYKQQLRPFWSDLFTLDCCHSFSAFGKSGCVFFMSFRLVFGQFLLDLHKQNPRLEFY
jgi:hypothetical protein